jgi:TIR domain
VLKKQAGNEAVPLNGGNSVTNSSDTKRDFFVSFNRADRAWATWIAWVLEEADYRVFFQDWDFKGNFVLEMDRAHTQSQRTLAVLSPDYLTSHFTAPEWAARFAQDATSEHDLLIPVRVRPCNLEGLLAQIIYVDLVDCTEGEALVRCFQNNAPMGSRCIVDFVAPSVDDWLAIDVVDEGQQSFLEFVFRVDADVAQDRTRQLGEEALNEIEP